MPFFLGLISSFSDISVVTVKHFSSAAKFFQYPMLTLSMVTVCLWFNIPVKTKSIIESKCFIQKDTTKCQCRLNPDILHQGPVLYHWANISNAPVICNHCIPVLWERVGDSWAKVCVNHFLIVPAVQGN